MKDTGEVIGAKKIDKSFRQISDITTDSIEPSPIGLIEPKIIYEDKLPVIQISVQKGLKPMHTFQCRLMQLVRARILLFFKIVEM